MVTQILTSNQVGNLPWFITVNCFVVIFFLLKQVAEVTLKCFQSVVGKNIRDSAKAQMQGILTFLAVTYLPGNILSQPYLQTERKGGLGSYSHADHSQNTILQTL